MGKIDNVWRYLVYDVGGKLVAEYGGAEQTGVGGVNYVMQDWQGSTRVVTNAHGFVRSRNDYTAFGEDVGSGTGLRTENQGFGLNASVRQKYGLTERDDATGLDHTWFRKHETQAGRWTSPDPYNGSMNIADPQSFNRYSYVQNEPTNYIDPSGLNQQGHGSQGQSGILWTLWYGNDEDGWRMIRQWFEAFPGSGAGGVMGGSGSGSGSGIENCKKVVESMLGAEVLRQALEMMKHPPLIDIESTPSQFDVSRSSLEGDAGHFYVGSLALPGESVGQSFDRNGKRAWAVRGYGVDGIYYRGSQNSFSNNLAFLFHEVLHMVFPSIRNKQNVDFDTELVDALFIDREDGWSDSELVDRFFQSDCDVQYGGPIF